MAFAKTELSSLVERNRQSFDQSSVDKESTLHGTPYCTREDEFLFGQLSILRKRSTSSRREPPLTRRYYSALL